MEGITHALLEHTANETTCWSWTVLERRGGGISINTAHGDSEERAARQKFIVRAAEASAL